MTKFTTWMQGLRWRGHARRLVEALVQAGVLKPIDARTHRHGRGPFICNCIAVAAREFHDEDPRDVPIPAMVAVAAALADSQCINGLLDGHCTCGKERCRWNRFATAALRAEEQILFQWSPP